jgi:hypothetical protein
MRPRFRYRRRSRIKTGTASAGQWIYSAEELSPASWPIYMSMREEGESDACKILVTELQRPDG